MIALAIVCLLTAAAVRREGPTPTTPPQQAAAWTPPETRLPRFLVTAAQTLFEQGLADPRGCEYRSIKVRVGSGWGGRGEVSTSGWILPNNGDKPAYAVAWNGLVYPLLELGAPADLDADVAGMRRPEMDGPGFGRRPIQGIGPDGEADVVALGSFHPLRVCLLLRLGRGDLAETLWTNAGHPLVPKPSGPGPNLDLRNYGVSYLSLATDFAWFRYNRAVSAHLRGDDSLALADARALDAFWPAVDARAAEMGFPPDLQRPGRLAGMVAKAGPRRLASAPDRARASRYINFLDQAPDLLADQERRARERENPLPPTPEGDKVAALIRALDQVGVAAAAPAMPQGGVLDQSATMRDLVALGDDAVEPLIQTLRTDDRLTRALSVNRGMLPRERILMRVDEAAHSALKSILKMETIGPPAMMGIGLSDELGDRNALADQFQEYWDKNKNIPLSERWYRTLADDRAGVAAWLEAAGNIVRGEAAENAAGLGLPFVEGAAPAGKLQGEPLREGHSPTVAELMIGRIESIRENSDNPDMGVHQSLQMAGQLATWDPAAAAPALRDLDRTSRERYARSKAGNAQIARGLAVAIARLSDLRVRVGDQSALAEYAEWLRTTSLDSVEPVFRSILEPLQAHPNDPSLNAAADWLFGDPESPWAALATDKGPEAAQRLGQLAGSPAIQIPAFRKLLQKALADDTVIGKAEITQEGMTRIRLGDNASMGRLSAKDHNDPDAPPIGAKADVRVRDLLAWQLAARGDAPHFNACWPEAKRDAVLAEFVEFLNREQPQ